MQHTTLILARAHLALGHGQAETALTLCEQLYGLLAQPDTSIGIVAVSIVYTLLVHTRALIALDQQDKAIELIERARQICEERNLVSQLWQVEVLTGQIFLDEDSTVAQKCFQQARHIIDRLARHTPPEIGAAFQQKAERIIASAARRNEISTSAHQLTRREVDVAREIARGRTNQQIADELNITVKTVETHITRALSKLNLSSRTQIALWAVENGLIPSGD